MLGLSAQRVQPYHGVFARLHGVALQETDHEHLHDQDSVAHPDAVARAEPERHECIWVHLLPAVFTEPARRDRRTGTLQIIKSMPLKQNQV